MGEGVVKLYKKYKMFQIGISFIIVLIFIAGMGVITYYKAVNIREDLKARCEEECDNGIFNIWKYYSNYPTDREVYQKELYDHVNKRGIEENDRLISKYFSECAMSL